MKLDVEVIFKKIVLEIYNSFLSICIFQPTWKKISDAIKLIADEIALPTSDSKRSQQEIL